MPTNLKHAGNMRKEGNRYGTYKEGRKEGRERGRKVRRRREGKKKRKKKRRHTRLVKTRVIAQLVF